MRWIVIILAVLISMPERAAAAACGVMPPATVMRDGQHDFDFEIGTWKIAIRRLLHPLTGSNEWDTPTGRVHIVQKIWGGRASLAQLEIEDPTPHYAGLMLRLYDAAGHQWRIYWASSTEGKVDAPLVGRFVSGRGEFFGEDTMAGKPICVRVVYSDITPTSFRADQAFSVDGGKTWETNLMQTFTRLQDASLGSVLNREPRILVDIRPTTVER
jgi:hypothetical protein